MTFTLPLDAAQYYLDNFGHKGAKAEKVLVILPTKQHGFKFEIECASGLVIPVSADFAQTLRETCANSIKKKAP